jgi:hypothetical protein
MPPPYNIITPVNHLNYKLAKNPNASKISLYGPSNRCEGTCPTDSVSIQVTLFLYYLWFVTVPCLPHMGVMLCLRTEPLRRTLHRVPWFQGLTVFPGDCSFSCDIFSPDHSFASDACSVGAVAYFPSDCLYCILPKH